MNGFTYIAQSVQNTHRFAAQLAALLQAGDVITLVGDLGAGKTTFTQGLAAGLGITERVNSPTFTIIKEYQGRLPLFHMDVYRLSGDEDLGFEEYFAGSGVTVIEWPSMIAEFLPEDLLEIEITVTSEAERLIRITPHGERYVKLCKEIRDEHTSDRYV